MNIKELSTPLTIDQIDFRVQSINKGGYATILAYKNARVDQQRLDDVAGPLFWKREHSRENHNCIVSIWNAEIGQWVSKEDTGTESNTEEEKGLASDSFKRACFNWGIGRELYAYPKISVKLHTEEYAMETDKAGVERAKATWKLQPNDWLWQSAFFDGKICSLSASDKSGVRFEWRSAKETISDEQVIELKNALSAANKPIETFLTKARIYRLEDLEASRFDKALKLIQGDTSHATDR